MGFCEQLELFDLRPYTTKQSVSDKQFTIIGVQELNFKDVVKHKHIQLELDLFPQEFDGN
jgi:hypothetical protein